MCKLEPNENHDNVVGRLKAWAKENESLFTEVRLIGSRSNAQTSESDRLGSDWDILLIIDDDVSDDSYLPSLAELGIELGVLIHPLSIRESEKSLKLSIEEYSIAYRQGKILFQRSKE